MSTLSSQMTVAYRAHQNQKRGLLRRYKNLPRGPNFEDFQLGIENSFLEGVHEAYQLGIVSNLVDKFGGQQEAAETMGLRHRTSISQMNRSGSINGVRITAALYAYPDQPLPPPEVAALFGFARATSHIKAVAYKDSSFERALTAQLFSCLVGLLAHSEWEQATSDRDEEKARILAEQIIKESAIPLWRPTRKEKGRREGHVLMLQNLWRNWAPFGILALCAIPERVPGFEEVNHV